MIRNVAVRAMFLCALVYSPVLPAQNPNVGPTTGGTESTTQWCFRGRPKTRRDVFWLTEFGAAPPLSSNPNGGSRGGLFTWELGGVNRERTRLKSSPNQKSYAAFCLEKKKQYDS